MSTIKRRTAEQMRQVRFNVRNIVGGYIDRAMGGLEEEEYTIVTETIELLLEASLDQYVYITVNEKQIVIQI